MVANVPKIAAHLSIIVVGLVLSLCFIVLLLVIVNSSVGAPAVLSDPGNPFWLFATRRSFFVYETVLAGMLGAYLGEIFQIGGFKTEAELRAYGQQFFVALFLGGASAVVVGVLFPLVVLGKFEDGDKINSWTLVAAAGIAGNRARGAFAQVDAVIARLLADFEPNIDSAAISKSVKAGVQEAFAVPPPVKYEGLAAVNVLRNNESVLDGEGNAKYARLEHGYEFELRVNFAPNKSALGPNFYGVFKSIAIREGDDEPVVPFRLTIDFGFIELPLAERNIAVPTNAASAVESFKFTVPYLEPGAATDDSSPSRHPEISVSIYQNTRYFDTIVIPTDVRT